MSKKPSTEQQVAALFDIAEESFNRVIQHLRAAKVLQGKTRLLVINRALQSATRAKKEFAKDDSLRVGECSYMLEYFLKTAIRATRCANRAVYSELRAAFKMFALCSRCFSDIDRLIADMPEGA